MFDGTRTYIYIDLQSPQGLLKSFFNLTEAFTMLCGFLYSKEDDIYFFFVLEMMG